MANTINATYDMLGVAIDRGNYWELNLGERSMTLSAQNGNTWS